MDETIQADKNGFTLIELLVAMVIAILVITGLAAAFVSQRKTYDAQEQVAEMVQNTRAAMDIMCREINMAGYDPANTSIVGVPYSPTQLEIRSDLNGDSDTSDANEDIIYTFDSANSQIKRDAGSGPEPFAEHIQSFTFQYYDKDGNSTTAAGDIRSIDITISARTSKSDPNYGQNSGYRTHQLTSHATPPNLDL